MVANACYPIHYFRLSFGKYDSLYDIVMELNRITNIPIDANREYVVEELRKHIDEPKMVTGVLDEPSDAEPRPDYPPFSPTNSDLTTLWSYGEFLL